MSVEYGFHSYNRDPDLSEMFGFLGLEFCFLVLEFGFLGLEFSFLGLEFGIYVVKLRDLLRNSAGEYFLRRSF